MLVHPTTEKWKRLVWEVFDTFATRSGLFHDALDTEWCTQNGILPWVWKLWQSMYTSLCGKAMTEYVYFLVWESYDGVCILPWVSKPWHDNNEFRLYRMFLSQPPTLLTPAQIKPKWSESRQNSLLTQSRRTSCLRAYSDATLLPVLLVSKPFRGHWQHQWTAAQR